MPVCEDAPIFASDAQVGVITSGGFSPSVGAFIAMGYVDAGHNTIGVALEAEVRGQRVSITVADLPFVEHRYRRKGASA